MNEPVIASYASVEARPTASRRLLAGSLLLIALNVAAGLGPRIVLRLDGLSLVDVWGSGRIRAITPAAGAWVRPLDIAAWFGLGLALATFVVAVAGLVCVVRANYETRTKVIMGAVLLSAIVGGYLSLETGFYLAGI